MLYLVIHEHRFGTSNYLVECTRLPTRNEIITFCDIDHDEERDDEFLAWESMPTSEIINIP